MLQRLPSTQKQQRVFRKRGMPCNNIRDNQNQIAVDQSSGMTARLMTGRH